MEKRVIMVALLGILLFIGGASAELLVGQTDSLYSIGDSLDFNITLSSFNGVSEFLIAKLVCGAGEIEIYRSPYSLASGERRIIPLSIKLDSLLLKNLDGICKIEADYGSSREFSPNFQIDGRVNIVFYAESVVNPGDEVKVSGIAKKSNGELLEGFLEISIADLGLSNKDIIKNGEFNSSLLIPKNSRSGSYKIMVTAYDKDNLNVVANTGNNSGMLRIKQIIKGVDIAFEKLEINPGQDFVYSVLLLDQAGDQSRQEIITYLIDPNGNIIEEDYIVSGVASNFSLDNSAVPGGWKVSSKFNGISAEKEFYVNEFQDVSFYVENNTLYVKNTGNIPFNDSVRVAIGEEVVIKKVDLGVGAIKRFKLSAPDGDYSIKVIEDQQEYDLGRTFLSGNSVAVGDYDQISGSLPFWIWLIILIGLCIIIIYFYNKHSSKRYYGKEPSMPRDSGTASVFTKASLPQKSFSLEEGTAKLKENKAASFGKKEKAVIIALNVRNLNEVASAGDDALAPIVRIIDSARKRGAKFKDEGNYKLFIFAPSIVKEPNLNYSAMQFLNKAESFLVDYNKKKALKINFGLGANTGELIIESHQGRFKVSSPGNAILVAKKAAARAKNEAVISQSLKGEMPSVLKTHALPGENFFKLNSVVNRSPQEEFLGKFMNRNKK